MKRKIFFLIPFFLIIPLLVLPFFSYFSADDYCYTVRARDMGWYGSQVFMYFGWSGRIFATFLLSTLFLLESILLYRLVSFTLIVFFLLSVTIFFHKIVFERSSREIMSFSLFFFFLYFTGMPSVPQGFFWLVGALTYTVPIILTLYFILIMDFLPKADRKHLFVFAGMILSLSIMGSNEASMLLLLALTFFYAVEKRKEKSYWLILFLSLLLSLFIIFAPGNSVRGEGAIENKQDILFSIVGTAGFLSAMVFAWVINPIVWICATTFVYFRKKGYLLLKNYKTNPLKIILLFIVLLLLSVFPAFWAIGGPPPGRNLNITYFIFLLFLFYVVNFLYDRYEEVFDKIFIKRIKIKIMFLILLFFLHAVYFSVSSLPEKKGGSSDYIKKPFAAAEYIVKYYGRNNFADMLTDIFSGRIYHYNKNNLDRRKALEMCGNKDICLVKEMKNRPRTIFFDDITDDPTDWRNLSYARFYNISAVRTVGSDKD